MDKYKDFQDLKDTSEQTLKNLFVKRNYSDRIDNPLADDIIIETADKVSTYEERMGVKKKNAVIAFQFPVTTDFEMAKIELLYLKPSEIGNYYIRKRVEAYMKICKGIVKEEKKNPKKGKVSNIRARAFCIALIQESGKMNFLKEKALRKNDIMEFVKITWGGRGRTVYDECLNIISEKNSINNYYKEDNLKEYELGLKLYKEMFPD
jgi:hypothetical protein